MDIINIIATSEEFRGKCLKLNFTFMVKPSRTEQLSSGYNIDNLAEARFKFVCLNEWRSRCWNLITYISLKKHALAKDSAVKVQCHRGDPDNSRHWLCTENWIDWQEFHNEQLFTTYGDWCYSTSRVNLTIIIIKEKSFIAEKMYEDVNLTDFTLNTSDGSVSVHKALISVHSDVFRRMVCGEWKETAEGHVKIDGVTLQTLQHLKQYMYLGTLPDDGLCSLLLIAMRYMMDELKSECISKLARTAKSENLDDLLNFAIENKVPELAFAILEMTPRNVVHGAYLLRKEKAVSENSEKES